nr:transposase [Adhaeribacter radiodurans]
MSRNYKFNNHNALYFITFSVVQWIDVFTRPLYRDIMLQSLRYCMQHKGLEVYAYIIMTNHVHAIIGSTQEPISDIIRDFKRHTSKEILKAIEANLQESRRNWMLWIFKQTGKENPNNDIYQFWQQNNHPIELNSNALLGWSRS